MRALMKILEGPWRQKLGAMLSRARSPAPEIAGEAQPASYSLNVDDAIFDRVQVTLAGRVSVSDAERLRVDLAKIAKSEPLKDVVIDFRGVEYFDTAAAAVILETQRLCHEMRNSLKVTNVPARVESFLNLVDFTHPLNADLFRPPSTPGLVVQIGDGALGFYQNANDIITFIGAVVVAMGQDIANLRTLKWDRLWKLIERAGSDAVPIVAMLCFLMGAVLGFQSAIQLRKFGANIFVADLVSISICMEMGPLLTAVIVAGRSGAAYAAHIGTMQVNEEIDALRVMGIDPIRYLVSPRVIAVAIALPCLTLIGDVVGILGGCVVAMVSLDLTPVSFFNEVQKVLELSDISQGLIKSFAFGIEIATIGCFRGFQVRGGAENVGKATTSAVVTSIFILTVTDACFAVVFYYLPGFKF